MVRAKQKMWYKMDEAPPVGRTIIYALQHLADTIPATVLIPLIVGGALGLAVGDMAKWIGFILFGMGIATILQSTLGTRYPIIQGGSYSFIAPYLVVAGMAGGGVTSLPWIMGALILGSLVEMAVGFGRVMGYIRRALTPLVIGIVLILIVLFLYPLAVSSASENWGVSMVVIISMLAFSLIIPHFFPRIANIQTFSLIIGMGIGYVISIPLGLVDFTPIARQPWFILPVPFAWGLPVFNAAAFAAILAGFFASMIESYGDYHAVAAVIGEPMPERWRINRGIGMEGVGVGIAGIFGGAASTSYTDNIGIIALTGVASRRVVWVAGVIMLLFGVVGKFGAVRATVPAVVLGGAWIVIFGFVIGYGVQWIAKADLSNVRNILIVGVSLMLGLGVPGVIEEAPVVTAWLPGLADILNSLLRVPMAVGGIVAIILEFILPGRMSGEEIEAVMRGEKVS